VIDPVVRPAGTADADALIELEDVARSALVDQRGGRRWLEEHPRRGERWRETIETDHVFVADLDGLAVGYLVLVLDAELARVDEVFVLAEAREVGFGDELIAHALSAARAAGAAVFEGQALPGDRMTKNLYERAGITARLITVSTRLDERGAASPAERGWPRPAS
jgi:GNAT superfamily N-acetyltransferase